MVGGTYVGYGTRESDCRGASGNLLVYTHAGAYVIVKEIKYDS